MFFVIKNVNVPFKKKCSPFRVAKLSKNIVYNNKYSNNYDNAQYKATTSNTLTSRSTSRPPRRRDHHEANIVDALSQSHESLFPRHQSPRPLIPPYPSDSCSPRSRPRRCFVSSCLFFMSASSSPSLVYSCVTVPLDLIPTMSTRSKHTTTVYNNSKLLRNVYIYIV